jgi:hypothetical protein
MPPPRILQENLASPFMAASEGVRMAYQGCTALWELIEEPTWVENGGDRGLPD